VAEKESTLPDTFVDFKEIKRRVSMEAALGHYNVKLRRVNQHSLRGCCPLPTHSSDQSKESFIVQTEKNIWVCQSTSCVAGRKGRRGGNVLDFVSIMANCSIRDAALTLHEVFVGAPVPASRTTNKIDGVKKDFPPAARSEIVADESNKPLAFALKEIDPTHPYLRQRGIREETATSFGVGYFAGRGSMSGRVVVPIQNDRGELVAYAGRSIDAAEPKYKLPAGFKKSAELFNLHRVLALPKSSRNRVVVCEGFFDCMKVHQAGVHPVVSLMGSALSDDQEKVLGQFAHVVLFLDGDEAGREAARAIAARLVHNTFARIVDLPDGKQPDQLSSEEILTTLNGI
jgi:DNA primase